MGQREQRLIEMRVVKTELHWDREGRGRAGEEAQPWKHQKRTGYMGIVTWERQFKRDQRQLSGKDVLHQEEAHSVTHGQRPPRERLMETEATRYQGR